MAAKASRQSFGEAIVRIAQTNPNIVVMDADLGKSTMTGAFAEKFPDRYFEMGIAEHNLIGTAAGLALAGKVPFATSFSCFLLGRYETIRISVSYTNANVKLIGTHAGVGIGEDGNSQMGLEDMGLLRSLPNFVLLQPGDDLEAQQIIEWAAEYKGPVFIRLTRQKLPDVHEANYQFKIGKGDVLKKGVASKKGLAAALFATGGVVYNTLKAAQDLEQEGYDLTVVNMPCIKPLDEELILQLAKQYKNFITVEDHYAIGGLGSAVSETLTNHGAAVKLLRHGVHTFGESGTPEELYEKFNLSQTKIKQTIQNALQ